MQTSPPFKLIETSCTDFHKGRMHFYFDSNALVPYGSVPGDIWTGRLILWKEPPVLSIVFSWTRIYATCVSSISNLKRVSEELWVEIGWFNTITSACSMKCRHIGIHHWLKGKGNSLSSSYLNNYTLLKTPQDDGCGLAPSIIASSPDFPSPSTTSALNSQKGIRHQSLYDAVTSQSGGDRFRNPSKVDHRTGKHKTSRPVAPETVLAGRWRRQVKRKGGVDGDVDDNEDVKLMEVGLGVPSHRNETLPDSVCDLWRVTV